MMQQTLDTKERISFVSRGTLDPRAPNTTKERIDLVAQGIPDPERAPQLLGEMLDAQDYLTVLHGYTEAQQYIDDLYKVYSCCFCK